jgi:hypothetical protein
MEWMDLVQWPAMVVTIAATWFTASTRERRRGVGFWLFLVSNALWVMWGWYAKAWALLILQVCLAAMNIRGARNNETGVTRRG